MLMQHTNFKRERKTLFLFCFNYFLSHLLRVFSKQKYLIFFKFLFGRLKKLYYFCSEKLVVIFLSLIISDRIIITNLLLNYKNGLFMDTFDKRTDNELVRAYQNGEQGVFDTLLERHKQKVYNYILSLVHDNAVADDIFQETFIKVINTLRSGTYHDEGKFIQWVMRIAHNLVIDNIRKTQKFRMVYSNEEFNVFDILSGNDVPMEDRMIKEQVYKDIRFLIKQLPKEQRRVLIMRHYAGMSFKEIAQRTGVSINTALGRMRYAIINMRRLAKENSMTLSI